MQHSRCCSLDVCCICARAYYNALRPEFIVVAQADRSTSQAQSPMKISGDWAWLVLQSVWATTMNSGLNNALSVNFESLSELSAGRLSSTRRPAVWLTRPAIEYKNLTRSAGIYQKKHVNTQILNQYPTHQNLSYFLNLWPNLNSGSIFVRTSCGVHICNLCC